MIHSYNERILLQLNCLNYNHSHNFVDAHILTMLSVQYFSAERLTIVLITVIYP